MEYERPMKRIRCDECGETFMTRRRVGNMQIIICPACVADRQKAHDAAVELGRRGGIVGGDARAKKLSPKRRTEIARNAARARWDQ